MSMVFVYLYFFFSSRRRHTRFDCDWSSDVCSYDLPTPCTTSTLRCFTRILSPPVSLETTALFQARSRGRSICGAPKAMPRPAISCASSMTFAARSEEHTSELQSQSNLVCRLLLEKKKAHIFQFFMN